MKNTKIVFLYHKKNRYSINALLGAIESVLPEDYLRMIVLPKTNKNFMSTILKFLKEGYKVIGCISFFTSQLTQITEIVKELRLNVYKLKNKNLTLIAGGPHPTAKPKQTLDLGFDAVIIGEGEIALTTLLRSLLDGLNFSNIKIENVFLKGKSFPKVAFYKVSLDEFLPFSFKLRRFGPIEITRGCPYACSFCQTPRIFGTRVRHRSIFKILELIKRLAYYYEFKDFRFISPNALSYGSEDGKRLNLKMLHELLSSIRRTIGKNRRIFFGSFPSEVRPEHVTEETIRILKEYVDNRNIVLGAQSGSLRILKLLNRQHTVEDIYNAVYIINKYGFTPIVDFIFGLPDETPDDIQCTIKLIKDLVKMKAKIHAHTFMSLPQTPLERKKSSFLPEFLIEQLNLLISKGAMFGQWQKQQVLAKKIYEVIQ